MSFVIGDVEVAPNYFLALFKDVETGQLFRWEKHDGRERGRPREDLVAFLKGHVTVGFNWDGFDQAMVMAYLAGFDHPELMDVCRFIIEGDQLARYRVSKAFGLLPFTFRSIDIMPVLPLMGGLKVYAARAASPRIQDLPYDPEDDIDEAMRDETIAYCALDLENTELLFERIKPELRLRRHLSHEHGIQLVSKGDAQIAESVMRKLVGAAGGTIHPGSYRPELPIRYEPPEYLRFESPLLHQALERVCAIDFMIRPKKGDVIAPEELRAPIDFAGAKYQMGVGGLHSCEKRQLARAKEGEHLFFADVASYYPSLILTNDWYPAGVGPEFVAEYRKMVEQRLAAKRRVAECNDRLTELERELDALRKEQAGAVPKEQ